MRNYILLVEDNLNDAKMIMMSLKEVNIANPIIHLQDGAQALDYLFVKGEFENRVLSGNPIMILLDLRLPKVDGIEVLEKIKADDRTKSIPVTVFSSHHDDPEVIKCYALGVNSYITKPLDIKDFAKVVAQLGLYWMILNSPPPLFKQK